MASPVFSRRAPSTGARKGRSNPVAVKSSQNKLARMKYSGMMKRMSPPKGRPSSSGTRITLTPTDAVPQWALFRSIGEAIKRATGGK